MKTMENLTADHIRKSILYLAIQGKLVKQDPNDEPASELVKRIYEEKHRLIKEGKLKKDKNESYIYKGDDNCYYEKIAGKVKNITNELPFEIPQSWEWIRLNNLAKFSLGKTPVRNDPSMWQNGTIPWVSISDLIDKETITKTKESVTQTALKKVFSSSLVHKGTLLMSFKLTIGKVSILGMDAVHNEAIINLLPYIDFNHTIRDYLFFGIGLLASAADKTTAIKGSTLNKGKLAELLIPLPPLKEQLRIISKIKFSEPLILRYQTQLKKLEELENNFEGKIKASILQYAIEGKLVKQDPNDEPASKLLERIKEEKERLVKEGKIKREKGETAPIKTDDKNYYGKRITLTLSEVCSYGITITKTTALRNDVALPLIELNQIKSGNSSLPSGKIIELSSKTQSQTYFEKGMILYSKLRPYLDKAVYADKSGVCSSELVPFWSYINTKWLLLYLHSPNFISRVNGDSFGVKMPRVKTRTFLTSKINMFSDRYMTETIIKVEKIMSLFC